MNIQMQHSLQLGSSAGSERGLASAALKIEDEDEDEEDWGRRVKASQTTSRLIKAHQDSSRLIKVNQG